MNQTGAEKFTKTFTVTPKTKITKKNATKGFRMVNAYFRPITITVGDGMCANFLLKNIRISPDKQYIEEDMFQVNGEEHHVGIARAKLTRAQRDGSVGAGAKKDLIEYFFQSERPTEFLLEKDYGK